MTSVATDVEVITGLILAAATIGGILRTTFKNIREAGVDSRDDEVRQLKSERDDARHERDVALADAKEWRSRYLDQRSGGHR